MKVKMIIKLFINRNDLISRTKAFKIVVSQPGVESATIKEGENFEVEVVGEQIDSVALINCLKKKLGQAQLVSLGPVPAGGNNADTTSSDEQLSAAANTNNANNTDSNAVVTPVVPTQPPSFPVYGMPQYQLYELRDPYSKDCTIM